MSEVKVNKITPTANCGTVTLGDSGDTLSIPSGATLSNAGSITNSGTITNTGTISGGTITGTIDNQVNWDTTAKTANFTAVAGNGYFVNTTSAAITVTLPASPSAGDLVGIKDYANTADTNNITIARNGSNIQGTANNFIISTEGRSILLIYVDATQGWLSTGASKASDIAEEKFYVTATGGTVITCGDFKTHIFTGPGTFCVSCAGNSAGSNTVDYMVVAGGSGGGKAASGGGGAGGFRLAVTTTPQSNPLNGSALPVSVTGYPIAVGSGGSGGSPGCSSSDVTKGSNSTFSTITSAAGGAGGGPCGTTGGSGAGGGSGGGTGAAGNTPPVSPPQGNPGGNGRCQSVPAGGAGGGGGGGGAAGVNSTPGSGNPGGAGGAGSYLPDAFIGPTAPSYGESGPVSSTRYFAGGGGGGSYINAGPSAGGVGGGGNGSGSPGPSATNASTNMGGGGGGGFHPGGLNGAGSNGGSGIVMIRYKYQN